MATDQQMQSFRDGVHDHFAYPPETWTVKKAGDRMWHVVRPDGAVMDRCTTKRAATEALTDGTYVRIWRDRGAWYGGISTDPSNRPLKDWEREIIAEVSATVKPRECGWRCGDLRPGHKHFAVLARGKGGKLIGRLRPDGTTTIRNVHAAILSERQANEIAEDINNRGEFTAKVIPF